jgi:hypothetical protein
MDSDCFDRLASVLGHSHNRRTAARLFGAALFGVGGLAALKADTDAKPKRGHHHPPRQCHPPCAPDQTCRRGVCVGGGGGGGGGTGGGGGDQCNPPCQANETCQNGACVCVPNCQGKNCGDDGCGGSCGGSCAAPTCQGTTLTTQSCDAGVCTPHPASCAAGQVCFQDACCTKRPQPSCHKTAISDGCGGTYQPNCAHFCCDGPGNDLICQTLACP